MDPHNALPAHVAIVMDGNGRWAASRHLPRIVGHKSGVDGLKRIVKACVVRKIQILTVFAFSSENWNRPADEVSGLMDLMAMALSKEVGQLQKEGVRLHFVGNRSGLSPAIRAGLEQAEERTAKNTTLVLNVCFNYGGKWDIANAAAQLAAQGIAITEESLDSALALSHCAEPDLIIRTGGEHRLSNFLLWQAAYAELYFSPVLWPDFDDAALDAALLEYAVRERRYGKTSAQIHGSLKRAKV
jgi:undecaprenyl diphosphate synthase